MLRTSAIHRRPWSYLLTAVTAAALVWGLVVALPGTSVRATTGVTLPRRRTSRTSCASTTATSLTLRAGCT